MIIERKKVSLLDETFSYAFRKTDEENVGIFQNLVQKYIEDIKKIVTVDLNKICDEDYFKLLSSLFYITFDLEDCLDFFSKHYAKSFDRVEHILTTMSFCSIATEGRKKSFDWWEQLYQTEFVVAVASDTKLLQNHAYPKSSLKKMIEEKRIVLLQCNSKPIDFLNNVSESYEHFDVFNCNEVLHNHNFVTSLLRKKVSKRQILLNAEALLVELQQEIQDVFEMEFVISYSNISSLCKAWYQKEMEPSFYDLQNVLQLRIQEN